MHELLIKAFLTGIGIAIISGPIGSLMVWQRMAYFGDTLAHATLLGVSFAVLLNINIYYGLIFTCITIAIIVTNINNNNLTNDTALSILSNLVLSLGLIAANGLKNFRIDLLSYLYGDILAVTYTDLMWIFGMDLIVLIILSIYWEKLVLITINKDIAIAEGIHYNKLRWIFIILLSLVFAISVRLVGVLLINSLLVIPCSLAKNLAKSPKQMAILGSIYSSIAIILGILTSFYWDLPTGPSIVISNFWLLLANLSLKLIKNRLNHFKII